MLGNDHLLFPGLQGIHGFFAVCQRLLTFGELASSDLRLLLLPPQQLERLPAIIQRLLFLLLLLLPLFNLAEAVLRLVLALAGDFPGPFLLIPLITLAQLAQPVDHGLVVRHPLVQGRQFCDQRLLFLTQAGVVTPGLAGGRQQFSTLALHLLDNIVPAAAGHFAQQAVQC